MMAKIMVVIIIAFKEDDEIADDVKMPPHAGMAGPIFSEHIHVCELCRDNNNKIKEKSLPEEQFVAPV
jgi:hypothetical protein